MWLVTILKHCFTGVDNKTTDLARVLWAVGVLVYLGVTVYSAIKGHGWQPLDFGTGFAGMMAGGGSAVAIKAHTEPRPEDINKDDQNNA